MDSKAMMYTFDALLAAALLITAALLYAQVSPHQVQPRTTQYASQDTLLALNTIPVYELEDEHPFITQLYNETELNRNDSLLYAIGLLWVRNDSRLDNLTAIVNASVPADIGFALTIEEEDLLRRNVEMTRSRSVGYQQITGIDQGKPIAGTSSSAYLNKIRDKRTSAFAYFGGFIGQGNLTVHLSLPADVNSSRIQRFVAELDTPQQFTVRTNGNACGQYIPQTQNMSADLFTISSCIAYLQPGDNVVELLFEDIEDAYVAGGYLRADYTTDEFTTSSSLNSTEYAFPGIDGVINLYDAAIIPGTLDTISARLHYRTNQSGVLTYLSLGEKEVYRSNQTGEVDVLLNDDDFLAAGIDYEQLSNNTVPLRFASFNATTQVVENATNADVVVITDYSGSMRLEINGTQTGDTGDLQDCETSVYTNEAIRRSHLARCLDMELVKTLLNYTGNRVYPVHFYNNDVYRYINPEDEEALLGHYSTYTSSFPADANGGTGLASALSQAYEIFETYSSENRTKVIVFMSDGLPSHCARDPDLPDEWWQIFHSDYDNPQCDNQETRFHPTSSCSGNQNAANCQIGGACSQPIDNTEQIALDLYNDFNVTIHSVAFGPIGTCDSARVLLENVAILTNGTYSSSSDIEGLRDVYANISQEIIEALELSSQTLSIPKNITSATLYADSYLRFSHSPPVLSPQPNEIELTRQTDPLESCDEQIQFPSGIRIRDATLTSYSAEHWTDGVRINDTTVYNLSEFLISYSRLGDPYRVQLPAQTLSTDNLLTVRTGDSPSNSTGCSQNNTVIYTAYVPSSTASTPVLENARGCTWTVEYDTLDQEIVSVPSTYMGNQTCEYTSTAMTYDQTDAVQQATFQLLETLDFDSDGRIFIGLDEEDLEIVVTQVSSVPYLWGPIMVRTEVWQ